jgi:MarR family transcriptional regulator, transcriptional regulator for hemolysin
MPRQERPPGPSGRPRQERPPGPSGRPSQERPPIGLHLAQVAKTASRAFDEALARAGGSLPTWLVLISVKARESASQREIAEAAGIRGATLTHHLNALEAAGLVTRRRDPANRRVHVVELTAAGDALFLRLRDAALAFDEKLRAGLSDREISQLAELLSRLRDNITYPGISLREPAPCSRQRHPPAKARGTSGEIPASGQPNQDQL